MATRTRSAERFKYGVCLNDECSKCKSKEVQQIPMRKDFVCEECGKELRECPPPSQSSKKPLIYAVIGIAIVAVLGVGGYFIFGGSKEKPKEPVVDHSVLIESITADGWTVSPADLSHINKGDTIWLEASEGTDAEAGVTPVIKLADSTAVIEPATVTLKDTPVEVTVKSADGSETKTYILAIKRIEKTTPVEDGGETTTDDDPVKTPVKSVNSGSAKTSPAPGAKGSLNMGYGNYTGDIKNGRPDGNGTLVYTTSHRIVESKDYVAHAGESVTGLFREGKVQTVKWYHRDGSTSMVTR